MEIKTKDENSRTSFLKILSDYCVQFSNNTSINGFKYLVEGGRSLFERLCWFLILCISIYFCGSFIFLTWEKWQANPIYVSFIEMNSWDIPFPAVTVCPENQVMKRKYNFGHHFYKLENYSYGDEELSQFEAIYPHCPKAHVQRIFTNRLLDSKSIDFFVEHATSLDEIFGPFPDEIYILRKRQLVFSPILIDGGLCFSFNSLDTSELFTNITYLPKSRQKQPKTSDWTLDDNYGRKANRINVFPRTVVNVKETFYFLFAAFSGDIDEECDNERGFKIFLHHPAEIPTIKTRYLQAAFNHTYNIWVKPDVTVTSENLKSYSPYDRKCFLANERKLKYYKVYTQQNCKIECLANYTLRECGCVSYYMPHENSTKICGFREDTYCVVKAEEDLSYLDMQFEDSDAIVAHNLTCNCLPSCTSITYNMEVSQNAEYNVKSAHDYFTQMNMRFRDAHFFAMERNALFSNTDFWASCGGIFGLFIGFSVMSLVEILYFLSLRWICDLCSYCYCRLTRIHVVVF